jgi:hypothetical protein
MPRAPRLRLTSTFKEAVRADQRGIVRLAALAGFPAYPALSKFLHAPTVRGTALVRSRLEHLASVVGVEKSEVFCAQ